MLASWLRIALILEALLCIGAALFLGAGFRFSGWAVTALGFALFISLNSVAPVTTYLLAWISMRKRHNPIGLNCLRLIRAAVPEWLASLALFVVIQPFARWWMPRAVDVSCSDGRPVLLVHGYLCNRAVWWWFARHFRKRGLAVAAVDLEPPLAGIDELAECLHERIEQIAWKSREQKIVLISHSMGGLVARAYLRRYGSDRVAKLITLGTPHRGTELARLGLGRNARQMRPDSAWLCELIQAGTPAISTVTIWSETDNFILPQDHARLSGAREYVVQNLGHLAMAFSPAILEILAHELQEPIE
jgi:triacylglycerol lipase